MAAAKDAGLDEQAARAEGEALAATIAEPSRGAFVDWSRETGRAESAQEFMDAASRGRRYRSAPTPSMAALALDGSVHAASYAEALSDVAMAACSLGEDNPRAVGNAATAAAAQLRGPGTTSPSLALGTPREPVPGPTPEFLSQVMDQLGVVRKRIEGMGHEAHLEGSGGPSQRVPDQPPQTTAPAPETPAEPEQPKEARAAGEDRRGAPRRARRARRAGRRQGRDPPAGGRAATHVMERSGAPATSDELLSLT